MDLKEFERVIRERLVQARDSLARIEETVRESGETPALMETSRAYAEFCLHAREYLHSLLLRRPLPRRFSGKVTELENRIVRHETVIAAHGLHPSPAELRDLAAAAQGLPERT